MAKLTPTYTFTNGLTASGSTVKWGGTLIQGTVVNMNTFPIVFAGASDTGAFQVWMTSGKSTNKPAVVFADFGGTEFARISYTGDTSGNNGDLYFGYQCGANLTTNGQLNNTYMGWGAGRFTQTGTGNAFYGAVAGYRVTTAHECTLIGCSCGVNLLTGQSITAVGDACAFTGATMQFSECYGAQSYLPGAGQYNTSIGYASSYAISSSSTAQGNFVGGVFAMAVSSYTNNNVILGYDINWNGVGGFNILDKNILIGASQRIGGASPTVTNSTFIGYNITSTLSNVAVLGRADQNAMIGYTNPTTDTGDRLQVNGGARFTNNIIMVKTGTGEDTSIRNPGGGLAGYAAFDLYPNSGTNTAMNMALIPKGTGQTGNKAGFSVFGSDFIADSTNYEYWTMTATGTQYTFGAIKNGTGAFRPMIFASDGTTGTTGQLYLSTTGFVGIGRSTDDTSGAKLQVSGSISGSTYTSGSVLFAGASGLITQDNTNFNWDNTNGLLKIQNKGSAGNSNKTLQVYTPGVYNIYLQGTAAAYQTAFYMDNDRGGFASYGGFLYGSSTSGLGNLFGVTRSDKLFMFADGASNLGFYVGTLQAQPFVIGVSNAARMEFKSTGGATLHAQPYTSGTTSNGLIIALDAQSGTTNFSYGSIDFTVPTTGTVGQFFATAANYQVSGGPGPLFSNSVGLLTDGGSTNSSLTLGNINSGGFINFITNGFTNANERMRIDQNGRIGLGITPSGTAALATTAFIQARTNAQNAKAIGVGGSLYDHFADVTNGTNVETDLYTDTIAASVLGANGEAVTGEYFGQIANTAATKTLKLYFGGTVIYNSATDGTAIAANQAIDFCVYVSVVRDSSTSVRCGIKVQYSGTSPNAYVKYIAVTGLTLTNTQIIKITGTSSNASANTDLTAKVAKINFIAQAA